MKDIRNILLLCLVMIPLALSCDFGGHQSRNAADAPVNKEEKVRVDTATIDSIQKRKTGI